MTTTNGIRDDGAELSYLLAQHQANTSRKLRAVVADCKYGDERELHRPGQPRHPRTDRVLAQPSAQPPREGRILSSGTLTFKYDEGHDHPVRWGRFFTGVTLTLIVVTMTMEHDLEYAGAAGWPRTAPARRSGASLNRYPRPPPPGAGAPQGSWPDRATRSPASAMAAGAKLRRGHHPAWLKRARWRQACPSRPFKTNSSPPCKTSRSCLRKGRLGYLALWTLLQQWLRQLIASPSNFPPFRSVLFA